LIAGDGAWGTDQVAFCLGEGLRAAGHEVIYAANPAFLRHCGLLDGHAAAWPIETFRPRSPRTLWAFNRRASGADLVLAHDSGARHFGLVAKALGLRPPLWFMRHCLSGTTRAGGVQLHRLMVAQQLAVSDAVRNSLVDSGFPAARVTRIYGGVNLARFQHPDAATVAQLRARFLDQLPPDAIVLGMVARIHFGPGWRVDQEDYKGYDLLFQALARERFDYRVLVLGPDYPGHQDAVRQMAAHYAADPAKLRFAGFVRDPANYYPLMDVNVLPSRGEGLGLTLIESMAAGVATVGSRSGGAAEIIDHEHTGLLFERGNPVDLSIQLARLALEPKLRKLLAQSGQSAVAARFDAQVMVQAFCERVAQVLTRSGHPVPA
jgi:glycosyltransferase involved in cell wall biosynthesis